MTPVTLHLYLVGPPQEKEISIGAKRPVAYLHMQASFHHIGQQTAQDGSTRVVVYIGNHGFAVPVVKTNGVVVIIIKERSVLPLHQGIILLSLLS